LAQSDGQKGQLQPANFPPPLNHYAVHTAPAVFAFLCPGIKAQSEELILYKILSQEGFVESVVILSDKTTSVFH
jgi:hypothetical protein